MLNGISSGDTSRVLTRECSGTMLRWRSLDEMSGMVNTSIEGVSARATYRSLSRMQTPMMGFGRSKGDTILVSSRTGANRYGFIDAKINRKTTLISSFIIFGKVI